MTESRPHADVFLPEAAAHPAPAPIPDVYHLSLPALDARVTARVRGLREPNVHTHMWMLGSRLGVRTKTPNTPDPDVMRVSKAICDNRLVFTVPGHPFRHKFVPNPGTSAARNFWQLDAEADQVVESFFEDESARGGFIDAASILERRVGLGFRPIGGRDTSLFMGLVCVHPLINHYDESKKACRLLTQRTIPYHDPGLSIAERLAVWTKITQRERPIGLRALIGALLDRPYASADEVDELRDAIAANPLLDPAITADTWHIGGPLETALTPKELEGVNQATALILDFLRRQNVSAHGTISLRRVIAVAKEYGLCESIRLERAFRRVVSAHPDIEPLTGQEGIFQFRRSTD